MERPSKDSPNLLWNVLITDEVVHQRLLPKSSDNNDKWRKRMMWRPRNSYPKEIFVLCWSRVVSPTSDLTWLTYMWFISFCPYETYLSSLLSLLLIVRTEQIHFYQFSLTAPVWLDYVTPCLIHFSCIFCCRRSVCINLPFLFGIPCLFDNMLGSPNIYRRNLPR